MLFYSLNDHCEILRVIRHNRHLDLGNVSNKYRNHCFITIVNKLRRADMFCVALQVEQQYLKWIATCRLIFNFCFIYQCAYTSSYVQLSRSLRDLMHVILCETCIP